MSVTTAILQQQRDLVDLVTAQLEPLFVQLRRQRIHLLCTEVAATAARTPDRRGAGWQVVHDRRWNEIEVLLQRLDDQEHRLGVQQRAYDELAAQVEQAVTEPERNFLLRQFVARHVQAAVSVGASYDLAALYERLQLRWSDTDIEREIILIAIGVCLADEVRHRFVGDRDAVANLQDFLTSTTCVGRLEQIIESEAWWRHRVAALRSLALFAGALPLVEWARFFPTSSHAVIFRACYQTEDPIWVQIAALDALRACDEDQWLAVAAQRLAEGSLKKDDDLFVRHHIVQELATAGDLLRAVQNLAGCLTPADISDRVRQGALTSLCSMELRAVLPHVQRALGLMRGEEADACPAVRAAAIVRLLERLADVGRADRTIIHNIIHQLLLYERHPLPLRVLLELMPIHLVVPPKDVKEPFTPPVWCTALLQAMDNLSSDGAVPLAIRRVAQESRDAIVIRCLPQIDILLATVRGWIETLPEGGRRRIRPQGMLKDFNVLSRLLVDVTREGFGVSLRTSRRGFVIQRGDRFQPKPWRFLYELGHPGPDKRQGFTHIVARVFAGPDRIHPLLLGEESPTKVPGEPVFCEDEGQWRRYLPLVDDCFDCARGFRQAARVRLHSAQGVVELTGPAGWWAKRRLYLRLVRQAGELAKLRQLSLADLPDGADRHPYIARLAELGLQARFHPHGWIDGTGTWHALIDPTLQTYFGVPVISRPGTAEEVVATGVKGITLLGDLEQLPAETPAAAGMDEVATERAVRTGTVLAEVRKQGVDAGIAAAIAGAGLSDEIDVLPVSATEALMHAASRRLRRSSALFKKLKTEARDAGAADADAVAAETERQRLQEAADLPVDRHGTEAIASAASERVRRRTRHSTRHATADHRRTTARSGQTTARDSRTDTFAWNSARMGPSASGSYPRSEDEDDPFDKASTETFDLDHVQEHEDDPFRTDLLPSYDLDEYDGADDPETSITSSHADHDTGSSERRKRLVEDRELRETMEHHRSVTQQLRRLRQQTDEHAADTGDEHDRSETRAMGIADPHDDLETERAEAGVERQPSSDARRRRLVEDRELRETMEHHRSVTQQLRRLREQTDDQAADAGDEHDRIETTTDVGDNQDELDTERVEQTPDRQPSSHARRRRLVEDRDMRETIEHHRSVTQQLRLLQERGDAGDSETDQIDGAGANEESGAHAIPDQPRRQGTSAIERIDEDDDDDGPSTAVIRREDES